MRVYYHIWLNKEWRSIFNEQKEALVKSGLYNDIDQMAICAIGEKETFLELENLLLDKMILRLMLEESKVHEFFILNYLYKDCKDWLKNNDYILYFHSKGVSYDKNYKHFENLQDWRRYMEYFLIYNYKKCIECLKNHDVCGVNWWDDGKYPPHFSGNFWWTKTDYIKKLSKPVPGSWGRRNAEFWIGTGQPKVKNLFTSGVNHYTTPFKKERYEKRRIKCLM